MSGLPRVLTSKRWFSQMQMMSPCYHAVMRLAGAIVAVLGALFWIWPGLLLRPLMSSFGAYRIVDALPLITAVGVALFVVGQVVESRKTRGRMNARQDRRSRTRQTRRSNTTQERHRGD